jgi:hypothetical protein
MATNLEKKQIVYNYNCKDFLSAKNTLNAQKFVEIFLSPDIKQYKKKIEGSVPAMTETQSDKETEVGVGMNSKKTKKSRILEANKISHTYLK